MGKQRSSSNRKGKLMTEHSNAVLELAQAWDTLRQHESTLAGASNRADVLSAIEVVQDRIGALQKFIEDTYNEIAALVEAKA